MTVAVPEVVMVPGVMGLQERPVGRLSASVTVPVKLLIELIVIVELSELLTRVIGGFVSVIVKSAVRVCTTVTSVCVECASVPLVPVTVTV